MAAFKPLVGEAPVFLILGSMPGLRSISEKQYYAHPQNSFWWIMSQLIGFREDLSYHQKCDAIVASGFALWDVLFDCERKGSLDSNIERGSEKINDFARLLSNLPTIQLIGFNGLIAKKIFMRHYSYLFNDLSGLSWRQLPSSSAAHASLNRQEKLLVWRKAFAHTFNEEQLNA